MARTQRHLTPHEAWRRFEEAMRDITHPASAVEWLKNNQDVAKKMTPKGLISVFTEDTKKKR